MIKFIFKGIIRDSTKSLIPILVISVGVMITVVMSGFLNGMISDLINQNAKLDTGHLKIMTKPYAENKDQLPNDLAILELEVLIDTLKQSFPDLIWTPRIKFGGIIDVPDDNGNTKIQGPGIGLALSLKDINSGEKEIFVLPKSNIFPSTGDKICLFLFELIVMFELIVNNSDNFNLTSVSIPTL